jgi:tryptophan 2,3-dioxygenase
MLNSPTSAACAAVRADAAKNIDHALQRQGVADEAERREQTEAVLASIDAQGLPNGERVDPQRFYTAYADCVSATAANFKAGELSGDPYEIVTKAAELECSSARQNFLAAVHAFTTKRHPELGSGGRAKVTYLFVHMREQQLENEIAKQLSAKESK